MISTPIRAADERVLPFAPDQIWPVLAARGWSMNWTWSHKRLVAWLGLLLPPGKLHSKFMREVTENLERETARRAC